MLNRKYRNFKIDKLRNILKRSRSEMFLFIVRVNLISVCICAVLKFINQYVFVNSFNRNYVFFALENLGSVIIDVKI